MHCPNCRQTAQPGLARCGHCNFKLPEMAFPTATANGKIDCWNCTHTNEAHMLQCAQCNAKLEKPATQARKAAQRSVALTPNTSSHDE